MESYDCVFESGSYSRNSANLHLKDVTQTWQQRPKRCTVTPTLHASKYKLTPPEGCRRLRSLLLCLRVFQALINSLVGLFCMSALGLVLFQLLETCMVCTTNLCIYQWVLVNSLVYWLYWSARNTMLTQCLVWSLCLQRTESLIALATVLLHNSTLKSINVNRPILFTQMEEPTVHFAKMLKVSSAVRTFRHNPLNTVGGHCPPPPPTKDTSLSKRFMLMIYLCSCGFSFAMWAVKLHVLSFLAMGRKWKYQK